MSPTPQDENEVLLASYALGEADPDTIRRVERLLQTQPEYRAILESYQSVADVLPLAPPAAVPSAALRDRVIQRIDAEAHGTPLPAPRTAAPPPRWHWRRWAVALNLAVMVGLVGWNVQLQRQSAAETARFQRTWNNMVAAMSAPGVEQYVLTSSAAGSSSAFLFAPDQQLGCLVVRGLPALPADQTYQVWLSDGQHVASAGTFRVNAQGNGWLIVNQPAPIASFSGVFVTVEPLDGSPQPTSDRVVQGEIS